MNRLSCQCTAFSKVSPKGQTLIPREVREQLKPKPGDTLRYRVTDDGILRHGDGGCAEVEGIFGRRVTRMRILRQ
jgi:AbrB family looped-hinge helix DNA binding protein